MAKIKLRAKAYSNKNSSEASPSTNKKRKLTVKIKPPGSSESSTSISTINSSNTSNGSNTLTIPRIGRKRTTSRSSNGSTEASIIAPTKKKIRFKLNNNSSISSKKGKSDSSVSTPRINAKPRLPSIKLKVFGDGYDSEDPDKEEEPLIEEGIVLRFMDDPELEYVHELVESNSDDLANLQIRWKDSKRAVVVINNSYYLAKLVDLPTISEVQKSVDKKNIFKTIDVSQMLVCFKKITEDEFVIFLNEDEELDEEEDEAEAKTTKEIMEKLNNAINELDDNSNDGITPPMVNVRKTRFKPNLNVRYIEKIENKVDELLRLDDEAQNIQLELTTEEDYLKNSLSVIGLSTANSSNVATPSLDSMASPQVQHDKTNNNDDDEDLDLELEEDDERKDNSMNNQEEGEDDDEIDDKEIDNLFDDESDTEAQDTPKQSGIEEEDEDEEEEDDDEDTDEPEEEDEETSAARQVHKVLKEEIKELESTLKEKEAKFADIHSEILKVRVLGTIQKLKHELDVKKRQLKNEDKKFEKKMKSINDENDKKLKLQKKLKEVKPTADETSDIDVDIEEEDEEEEEEDEDDDEEEEDEDDDEEEEEDGDNEEEEEDDDSQVKSTPAESVNNEDDSKTPKEQQSDEDISEEDDLDGLF